MGTRIAENFDVSDFKLTPSQLEAIDALGTGHPWWTRPRRRHPRDLPLRDPKA
jgi:diketogulonate reductase-like aldo/keto reductase